MTSAMAQNISGEIRNTSLWREQLPAPPGDGDGLGLMLVFLLDANGLPVDFDMPTNGVMPFAYGPYPFTLGSGLAAGSYQVIAWVDGNMNGTVDDGEPYGQKAVAIASNSVSGVNVVLRDSNDGDNLPDWWEYHWFRFAAEPLAQGNGGDPDNDGLSNIEEWQLSNADTNLVALSPANWDTDNDGLDDGWEAKYYSVDYAFGMNPTVSNKTADLDGDGLSAWQEYCGVDQVPRMVFDQLNDGVLRGRSAGGQADDLNPLDIDTDYDMLLDSFEAAWYDPANGIDPKAGTGSQGTNINFSIARADSDKDGLSNYREQCLLADLRQASANGDKWDWEGGLPFPQVVYAAPDGEIITICLMDFTGVPMNLGLVMDKPFSTSTNRFLLRHHEWTDPTEGTGYTYADENIPPGHDTDDDWLPDGWEVQFNLDPRDDGMGAIAWTNGPFGDPDDDGLLNIEEYLGQDGNRNTTLPYVNGTGDETNPNEYNWRPDSTYEWRWYPSDPLANPPLTDPRSGAGISRRETLGSALPTTSLGKDPGKDTDDDGIPDADEINPPEGVLPSSPVHSCDPFIPRSALITSSNGIPIPDWEPAAADGIAPAGMREDLQRRDWTIECQIKLLGTNLSGNLFNFQTKAGAAGRTVYRLALSNNVPVLSAHNAANSLKTVKANALPTNRWVHVAGVWDHANNSLGLYVGGVLFMAQEAGGEGFSKFMFPATNALALAAAPNGSFVNRLMLDEVRIWGVARTREQIAQFANTLVPVANGDDVWIDAECPQFYNQSDTVIVDGGSLFEGEPGVTLSNVYSVGGNYWIDNGDGQYNAAKDVLLKRDDTLVEGLTGNGVGNVLWNDKDGSGGFSRDSLLAYYRFDDGGATAEDFARRAKNGLLGATREEFQFGDFGYALRTNNFQWVTNSDAALIYGVDKRGADDSDHDGLPDAWEIVHHLDPWDDGTDGESSSGAKDGPNGANGDPDDDGLINIYEYWSGTNPQEADSDGNGWFDAEEDRDGDGVANIIEQTLGSRPDIVDTDDDGMTDGEEQSAGTGLTDPTDPSVSRAAVFGGAASDYLEIPTDFRQRLTDWTLEAWVNPANAVDGAGVIVRRVVENLSGGRQAMNYAMGIETNAGGLQLYAGYVLPNGTNRILRGPAIQAGRWTHVAAAYNSLSASLVLYTNGVQAAFTNSFTGTPPVNGKGGDVFVRIGEDYGGRLDEIRLWNRVRTREEIASNKDRLLVPAPATSGLVDYVAFDDGEASTNVFPWGEFHQPGGLQDFTYENDWNTQWRHAAGRHGNVAIVEPGAIEPPPPPTLKVNIDGPSSAQWSIDGGITWIDSGEATNLVSGKYIVRYKPVLGWIVPKEDGEEVTLYNGLDLVLDSRKYTEESLTVGGVVVNGSLWADDTPPTPGKPYPGPGDGNGSGQIRVGLWDGSSGFAGLGRPATNVVLGQTNVLPFAEGTNFAFVLRAGTPGAYLVQAWIDGNEDGKLDLGEPFAYEVVTIGVEGTTEVSLRIADDRYPTITDGDGLPDWWQVHWFGSELNAFKYSGLADPDNDGLDNFTELAISLTVSGMKTLDPGNWDTDGDGMDDGWEVKYYSTEYGVGMNPTVSNRVEDLDGDGLSAWQEYCGVDRIPRMQADRNNNGVYVGKETGSKDDLNPLDIDTDYDMLLDSFEAAWYDPANGIDPKAGVALPSGTNVDLSIALADSDRDGLSNYREQCLLAELRERTTNQDKWVWSQQTPFPSVVYYSGGEVVRICRMASSGAALDLGLVLDQPFSASTNRTLLRLNEWTDPTEGTGYLDTDELIPPGHDTDDDGLPDGWEVEFNLDPKDDGFDNGPFGDLDGDGLMNIEEFLGQDGERSVTDPYINGTGDETNPNKHNWRPDSTYQWRWYPPKSLGAAVTDPRIGTGLNRGETLGGALPTFSLGVDVGTDSDDDGISDREEIHRAAGVTPSSPVHSCDPFIPRSALITSSNGIAIHDPEPALPHGGTPGGMREDLQRRDWTIECQVKLLGTNLNGEIFNFETSDGVRSLIVYRLSLSNNAPVLAANNSGGTLYTVTGNALPTNRWIHLAGVWNHAANSLGLYSGGLLLMEVNPLGECPSVLMNPATNTLALAVSRDGSFVNRMMLDEVRIWGVARTREQIAEFANKLVPIANGDDVWIDAECPQFYSQSDTVIVNGGSLFNGEPGVALNNVFRSGGSYWIDDGDGQYNAARDVLLARDAGLKEGLPGSGVGAILWNDKDGSGGFSRDALLAYYRFDDGGTTAEDFARRAKNGLLGTAREEYLFGDFGYALPADGFQWVTNADDVAVVYGVDKRGADDSDHDGLPDAWEIVNHLDPWDDGTSGETSAGAKDGPYGPNGDPDGDGLINIYEFWAGTNPQAADTDGDGILDAQEDRDNDGGDNITEQKLGSRPDLIDTDDDGKSDSEERGLGTSPLDASDPPVSRAVEFGGSASDYLDVPMAFKQRLTDWTLEAWVNPTNATDGAGYVLRRVVENLADGRQAMNYVMGVETNAGGLGLYAGYVTPGGVSRLLSGGSIPAQQWTHVAASYNSLRALLTLYVDGVPVASTNVFTETPPANGKGGEVFVRIGEDFAGALDEIRIWNRVVSQSEIAARNNRLLTGSETNGLIGYFAFDDGEANTNIYPWSEFHQPGGLQDYTYQRDWNQQWRHAARRRGNVAVITPGAIVPPSPPVLSVTLRPDAVVAAGAQWAVDDDRFWLDSPTVLSNLASGRHTIFYKPVFGWTAPPQTTIELVNGMTLAMTNYYVQASLSVRGTIYNNSVWQDYLPGPPGDGDGQGQLMVGLWPATASLYAQPVASRTLTAGDTALPLDAGPYAYTLIAPVPGIYQVVAWIDGDMNGFYDPGEPHDVTDATIGSSDALVGVDLNITDDFNGDTLPDWWQFHWFRFTGAPLDQGPTGDPDGDGLDNATELKISLTIPGLEGMNPADWDTDGDGMDDGWEYKYYSVRHGMGMDPTWPNATDDFDGDGLSDWQEYCGVDMIPPMGLDQVSGGIVKGKKNATSDDLNPLDIDTDFDLLLDSFEAAWYDPANGINPKAGVMTEFPSGNNVDTTIARADPDHDGLSNYREQCLLDQLMQASSNADKWVWSERVPFPQLDYFTDDGKTHIRICRMEFSGAPLDLGLVMDEPWATSTNRFLLRAHGWTDPTEGTGYDYVDEDIPPGHDSDGDGLPDGWEVEFNLNPRDDGMSGGSLTNGPFGDPDGDGLLNIEEFLGQDGDRSATLPYINGTGDETNPNEHNVRPDSTYLWRWYPPASLGAAVTDPRTGTGISRGETLGSALPTISLGIDIGTDSDDDGIPDAEEIHPLPGRLPSCPVVSCDPFIMRSALVTSSNGIAIPDPEPAAPQGVVPGGTRADLQRRDWTIECQVNLLGTNLSGTLFDFETMDGDQGRVVYRLALSNNAPVLDSHNSAGRLYSIAGKTLPTNRWTHLAGVWNHAANSLGLYVGGLLFMELNPGGECPSALMHPATNRLALAVSPDGSFVNRLMIDEVRIWGVARSREQIARYASILVPPANGDDVWIDAECPQYYNHSDSVIVNGGSLFEGEPGAPLSNVYAAAGNYWIDDGDGQFNAARDVLLARDSGLIEGLTGQAVANVLWNDRDGSGNFSRDSLLAYYRFDDGGGSAEDFARKAKSGLVGANREEYLFGDFGYALPTNGFLWVTNGAAVVYGVDLNGADDSDHDGLPDAWEIVNHLDPWDDGTSGETAEGLKNGPYGPRGDPDRDGLMNEYEYWAGTNPQAVDTDGDGTLDSQEDRDGDGVVNATEQELASRPDMVDTDDDGVADNEEQGAGTSPANPSDPSFSRAVSFGGAENDYLDVPSSLEQRLVDWTVEAWVRPTNAVDGAGIIVRRVVENLPSGQAMNFVLGLRTNGAGGLTLYGGYVTQDGTPYILAAGSVLPGEWTHVAASYNSLNASLTLYTNGGPAIATNVFYLAPPVSGRGGETFVRIGEDFAGLIDEVRIWSKARSSSALAANRDRVLALDDNAGLINYFRFDDGETATNLFPLGRFHQPGGLQDYTWERDWNAEWRHAAMRHGNVQVVTPGAIVAPPSLRVILDPPEVRLAGGQWSVDGGAWQNSGESLQGLLPGTHTLMFRSVMGWMKPPTETIALSNGVATTLTRAYVQQASVRITLDPPEAVDAGAMWRVDGGAWQFSGNTVTNLDPTNHVIAFTKLFGWTEPPTTTVTLSPGEAYDKIFTYSKVYGSVSAVILPSGAVLDGAQWRVDGGTWRNSGDEAGGLALTEHTIEFSPNLLWIRPGNISVTLTNETVMTVTGVYSQVTGLYVDIQPPDVVASGAQWRVSGGDWTNAGTLVEVPAGKYTVQFKTNISGWFAPGDVSITVVTQVVSRVTGQYFQADVFGGAIGSGPGMFFRPRGLAVDALHRLYVADTYNDRIQMYDPLSMNWTIWGQYGTNAGSFSKPAGVAVDAQGNVYVADSNNDRVQKRTASNGIWTVYGGFGTNLAKFNGPTDVAVDSKLNLYVADRLNDRVQRMTTGGVWSIYIPKGSASSQVTAPQGLLVDALDNLYVSDDGIASNGQNRIQEFNPTGTWVSVLGGGASAQGVFRRPGGMAIGSTNLYVADINNSRIAFSPLGATGMVWRTLLGSNVVNGAHDVTWDPRGILYIADTENHRIIAMQLPAGGVSNTVTMTGASLGISATNGGFTVYWNGRLQWLYAVQYANSLAPAMWQQLSGATNIPGHDAVTNVTDTTVNGATNRFYRVLGY